MGFSLLHLEFTLPMKSVQQKIFTYNGGNDIILKYPGVADKKRCSRKKIVFIKTEKNLISA